MQSEIPVFISFTNFGYVSLAENLLHSIKAKVKHHKTVMYCLDKETYEHLSPFHEPGKIELVLYHQFNTSKKYQMYNSDEFKKIDHLHISILFDAFEKYDFVHFLDSDTVIINEPSKEYYADYADYDIVFQPDSGTIEPDYAIWTCIGNMSLRNTHGTRFVLEAINFFKKCIPYCNDQEVLREVFNNANVIDIRNYPHAKLTQYPSIHYTCGALVDKNHVDFSQIKIFHANWVLGFEPKIALLKKVGAWYSV